MQLTRDLFAIAKFLYYLILNSWYVKTEFMISWIEFLTSWNEFMICTSRIQFRHITNSGLNSKTAWASHTSGGCGRRQVGLRHGDERLFGTADFALARLAGRWQAARRRRCRLSFILYGVRLSICCCSSTSRDQSILAIVDHRVAARRSISEQTSLHRPNFVFEPHRPPEISGYRLYSQPTNTK